MAATAPLNIQRPVHRQVRGMTTADGAGVRLSRVIGGPSLPMLDPFLMLDHLRSDDAENYIAGFPDHPHRGFETVTYLLDGRVRHRDNAGHAGIIEAGGVQWMSAGRGVVHSEMPERADGRLEGFQLWVNLPAAQKMMAPRYQEFGAAAIPVEQRDAGVALRVVAGTTSRGTQGPVAELVTPVLLLDVSMPEGGRFLEPLPAGWNAFVYAIEGEVALDGARLPAGDLALLGDEGTLGLEATAPSRLLVAAGAPIGEPVARYGPFVMNTEAELRQAFRDFQRGDY